jgi:lipid-binding SYLF domain-containing protein
MFAQYIRNLILINDMINIKSIIKIIIIPNENKKAIPDHLHIIDFLSKIRGLLLTRKLLSQGFILVQHNGQKTKYKRTNNNLQNIHIKLKME